MSVVLAFRTTKVKLQAPQLHLVSIVYPRLRRGGGGRRDRCTYVHGAITMLAFGLLLNTVGIALLCWPVFTLAVYAFPFFVAVSVGMTAFHSGAGVLGAPPLVPWRSQSAKQRLQ
jgi:hypothetical protein